MKAAIISVGSELLGGYAIDSNSTWISRKLMDIGIQTTFKVSVPDVPEDIVESLTLARDKADLIICTGGLGPTNDDVTKEAFCQFIGTDLIFDGDYYQKLKERFERRGTVMPDSNREQAFVPDGTGTIPNPKGSALGIKFQQNSKRYFILPGVPSEMKAMMEETVLPELDVLFPGSVSALTIRTTGIMESALYDLLSDLVEESDVDVSFLPGFMGVDVRLTHPDHDAVMGLASKVYDRASSYVYAEGWETMEEAVARLLRERGLTIAVAESCTGGLLSDRLTNVPGSSDYFLGGTISYSNESKMDMLGVQKQTLVRHGAVSEETASQMASGVRRVFQANIGVSITGIAGPAGGTLQKPVGLTFIGLDFSGEIEVRRLIFTEDRRFNKELAAQAALNMVRLALDEPAGG